MALDLSGTGGELRLGPKRIATLATWTKQDIRVSFTVGTVNRFVAGMGAPTHIVLPLSPKVLGIYPVVSGTLDDGVVKVDLNQSVKELGSV